MKIKKGDRVYPNPGNSFKSNPDWGWPCEVINTFEDVNGRPSVQFLRISEADRNIYAVSNWNAANLTIVPPSVEVDVVEILGAMSYTNSLPKALGVDGSIYWYMKNEWVYKGSFTREHWERWRSRPRKVVTGKLKIKVSPKGYV